MAKPFLGSDVPSQPASRVFPGAFTIRMAKRLVRFHQGEKIVLELGYGADSRAPVRRRWMHRDRPGLAVDGLHLEPRTGVSDPLRDFLGSVGGWDGPPPRPKLFVEKHDGWTRAEINEWFRFDKPGRYRLSVDAHPVRNERGYYFHERGALRLTSNNVEFEIVPADPAWQASTLHDALQLTRGKANFDRHNEGCRILRFLTTRAAVDAMIQHFSDGNSCGRDAEYGIFAFPDRKYVVKRLEDFLIEPSGAVDATYLRSLGVLSVYLRHPELLPLEFDQYMGTSENPMGGPLALAYWYMVEAEENQIAQNLIRALQNKTDAARAVCLKTLFDSRVVGQPNELKSEDPALLVKLGGQMVEFFDHLPVSEQLDLLYSPWPDFLRGPAVPVLQRICENPPPWRAAEFVALTLRRLYELSPSEGRPLILAEMKRPHPQLNIEYYDLLPDKEIPELDEVWAKNLQVSQGGDDTIVELIARYATASIFAPVLVTERDRFTQLRCRAQAAFLAYVFKCNRAIGAELLEKSVSIRKPPGCSGSIIGDVASRYMVPEIERVAIAHIQDPNPNVAANAVNMLGDKGSPATEQLLWDRLEKWHATWAGRAEELRNDERNDGETSLEAALVQALGTGQAWFAGRDKLARLSNLCLSPIGCEWVQAMVAQLSDPPVIKLIVQPRGMQSASVNQYGLDSLDSLRQKLSQFPKGTAFKWAVEGPAEDAAPVLAEIRAFLKNHGMTLR